MKKKVLIIFFLFVVGAVMLRYFWTRASENAVIEATIKITVCGNNVKESGEECDGSDLGGASCQSLGYAGGSLACRPDCVFDTSNCVSGDGGGGGGYPPIPIETKVIFSGRAYPLSKVGILKDGQLAVTTIAGPDANFEISLSGLPSGNYIFSVFGEDFEGRRSSLFTFPVFITVGTTTKISGIFLSPTIALDKIEVKKGDNIAIFGQSTPQSEITIHISSTDEIFLRTVSDKQGVYLYNFRTELLDYGSHSAKSKAFKEGLVTPFSQTVSFLVGTKNVLAPSPQKCPFKADLNNDCRVNLVDFSIAAYWYKRPLSLEFKKKELEKLSGDGKVDLVDFSIMAYYWTG